MKRDIFERDLAGEYIPADDPEFYKFGEILNKTQRLIHKLNTKANTQEDIHEILTEITGKKIDDSVHVLLPFYADFGQHITIGKNVFINMGCTFVDKGGLTIEDDVLLGPQVKILTVNHPIDPQKRKGNLSSPVTIKKNAWIGAGATIVPGVTVGENSVIGAGAVVTKDVPKNAVVAGVPAKIIRMIEE